MRVAGYIRVSTEEQAREGYSLSAQEEAIRAYATAHRWELVEVYRDAGRSGKSLKGREAVTALLADAAAGRFERLIFWKLDRLARNLRDLLDVSDRLDAAGVGIVSIQESIDTGSAAGRMMRNVLGSLAEFEREVIVERIRTGVEEKAREGKVVGPLSLGYSRDEAGRLTPNDAAPMVREAFERYATGSYSLRDIAQWAQRAGLKGKDGQAIDRFNIRKVLVNQVYVGDVVWHQRKGGGVIAQDAHPAIVDRELFARVQHQLIRRQRGNPSTWGNREPYPLTGVAICSGCHRPLAGCRANRAQIRYMRCATTARRGRDACSQPMVKADLLEGQVRDYLAGMRLPVEYLEDVIEELRARNKNLQGVADLAKLRKQVEGWRRLFVMAEIDELRYRREVAPLHRRIEEIEGAARPVEVEQAMAYLRAAGSTWEKSERATQRQLVTRIFDRIEVDQEHIVALTPKAEYAPLFRIDREERFAGDVGVVWLPGKDSNLRHAD